MKDRAYVRACVRTGAPNLHFERSVPENRSGKPDAEEPRPEKPRASRALGSNSSEGPERFVASKTYRN